MMNFEQSSENDWELPAGKAEQMIKKQKQELLERMKRGVSKQEESLKEWERLHERISRMLDLLDELQEKSQELVDQVDQAEDWKQQQGLLIQAIKLKKKEQKLRDYLLNDVEAVAKAKEKDQEELAKQADELEERVNTISSILESDPKSN